MSPAIPQCSYTCLRRSRCKWTSLQRNYFALRYELACFGKQNQAISISCSLSCCINPCLLPLHEQLMIVPAPLCTSHTVQQTVIALQLIQLTMCIFLAHPFHYTRGVQTVLPFSPVGKPRDQDLLQACPPGEGVAGPTPAP